MKMQKVRVLKAIIVDGTFIGPQPDNSGTPRPVEAVIPHAKALSFTADRVELLGEPFDPELEKNAEPAVTKPAAGKAK